MRSISSVPRVFMLAAACVSPLAVGGSVELRAQTEGGSPVSVPLGDHHAHLLSERGAERASERPFPMVELPADLAGLLRVRSEQWNDRSAMAELYTEDVVVHDPARGVWLLGRDSAAAYMSERLFARGYHVTPFTYAVHGSAGHIGAYFTRGEGEAARHFGQALFSVRQGDDGVWRISTESVTFPGPAIQEPVGAEQRIAQMDDAGIQSAVILSVAYWFGSPLSAPVENEYAVVREENDWTASEAARFSDRLIAFCSFNPLKEYALEELDRCARHPNLRGLKLHFANSGVDVRDAEHVEALRRIFRSANDHRLPIVAHLWVGDPTYGPEHAEIFLERILPEAPDITVQIAHFAGGGPGYTDEALEVFADAIAAGDPRTGNLYFDITNVADGQSDEVLQTFARRIRQVGLERVLFGVDLGPPAPRESWARFRTTVPLTDDEFDTVARNLAPYLR